MHLHLRDGAAMADVVAAMPAYIRRAVVMPNLRPPVTTVAAAAAYRDRILAAVPAGRAFTPLMTLYLTDNTPPAEIDAAVACGFIAGVKLYPAGATTNSDAGVTDLTRTYATLARMAETGLPLLIHGEVTDPGVDVFEREGAFIDAVAAPLVARIPHLRVVLEHITTAAAAAFVARAGPNVAATVTAHHLLYNRNALFEGGVRPHRYCLPVLKHEDDRLALLAAVASGSGKFFLGTDSAPHARASKECACGAAGMYTAHAALELYTLALSRYLASPPGGAVSPADMPAALAAILRPFACTNAATFYRLPPAAAADDPLVVVAPTPWVVPATYAFGDGAEVVPALAGEVLPWRATVQLNTH